MTASAKKSDSHLAQVDRPVRRPHERAASLGFIRLDLPAEWWLPESRSRDGVLGDTLARPGIGGARRCPAERGNEADVLVAEGRTLGQGVGKGGQKLVAVGAGNQVIVPEDADVALAALDGDLVPEAAGWVALHLADA